MSGLQAATGLRKVQLCRFLWLLFAGRLDHACAAAITIPIAHKSSHACV